MGQQSATQKQVWPDIELSAFSSQLQSVQLHAAVALSNVKPQDLITSTLNL